MQKKIRHESQELETSPLRYTPILLHQCLNILHWEVEKLWQQY